MIRNYTAPSRTANLATERKEEECLCVFWMVTDLKTEIGPIEENKVCETTEFARKRETSVTTRECLRLIG